MLPRSAVAACIISYLEGIIANTEARRDWGLVKKMNGTLKEERERGEHFSCCRERGRCRWAMGDMLRGDELVALRRKSGIRVSGGAWGLGENLGKIYGPEGCEMSGCEVGMGDHSLTSSLWRFGERCF